jgi:hypothetical protein
MAFIATRGFLGTPSDITLRGFDIGAAPPAPAIYAMTIDQLNVKPVLSLTEVSANVSLTIDSITMRPAN